MSPVDRAFRSCCNEPSMDCEHTPVRLSCSILKASLALGGAPARETARDVSGEREQACYGHRSCLEGGEGGRDLLPSVGLHAACAKNLIAMRVSRSWVRVSLIDGPHGNTFCELLTGLLLRK